MSTEHDGPNAKIVEEVLSGKEKIVSHVGASQYDAGGIAACGLAGLNFVRVVLARVEAGLTDGRLLEDVLSRRTSEEAISICSRWSSNVHLEVEDILKVPLFERALALVSSTYGKPDFERFRAELVRLQSTPNEYAAIVITRPPEIITCLKLLIRSGAGKQDVFIIFDSHPRSEYPDGAGLIVNTSVEATAAHLDKLLAVDDGLLADSTLQWQTQLLAQFSGHYLVPKSRVANSVEELTEAVLESSLLVLKMQAEAVDLQFQISNFSRERQYMESELEKLRDKLRTERQLETNLRSGAEASRARLPKHGDSPRQPSSRPSEPSRLDSSSSQNALEYFSSPANIQRSRPSHESTDYLVAQQLQMEMEREQRHHKNLRAGPKRKDALTAQAKQREFEQEEARLIAERTVLQQHAQLVFECGVCFDKFPEDDVTRIANCPHEFCRACMKTYVVSKLSDKLYPIFCPMCLADDVVVEPGMIMDDLVQMLGLTDQQYQILQELQIASLSILLHCRQCKEGVFVDRDEYEAAEIIVCPLPRCNYAWCKACQQAIAVGGPKHSCDGSSELEHLMQRSGWKHCPGCKTPFQKSWGCNHMTCMAPGCNTHFCYICGESIVRSALQRDVRAAVTAHYQRCRLFEDVPEN
ncbi:hypothetical protein GGX14DRAFT_648276 [Mycena pura]|uniref:RBR-type E3 ubiquitin transferase n=1 Tax=Mycena pura TaxID=153505 RepID=A0AAD7E2D0_9AGAR|nr:hypothetical protein GGX14DRAFT_648276 [Mycena pura]